MGNQSTSEKGIQSIALREGEILHGYKDSKGLLTIGVGHLVTHGEPYTLGGKITLEESRRLLKIDLATAEKAVNSAVLVPLTQNQFDALVSLTFNIGVTGFRRSTVVRKLNARDYSGAANAIMLWNKPKEIIGRRRTEQKQFLTPDGPGVVIDGGDESARVQHPELKLGDRGPDVGVMQKALNAHGFHVTVDNDFGAKTEKALNDFQQSVGLDADGMVGKLSWAALEK